MTNIKTASLKELRAMKDRGELLPLAYSETDIDTPDGFWDDAEVSTPRMYPSKHRTSYTIGIGSVSKVSIKW